MLSYRGAGNADTFRDFNVIDDTFVLTNALDGGLPNELRPGVLGLTFLGGPSNGNPLAAGSFFKGAGLTGVAAGATSGIYVNTTTGEIWYNPTTAAGGDAQLLGNVQAAVAPALMVSDFVYGS
ncbi:hypothetical protein OOT46_25360 [Aquabacterium sp. A7-Y]|uniref:hypothetical protein n=1 Tax=Aquabacterium sp. A7-Y TaxID=1349605 RepID=UPI00223D0724|nr:hypothetical protein [Aquabacterium sp. A7-Y]MCW7541146.1 hypothetical protein [Aquabacterium sp. A7-Y]